MANMTETHAIYLQGLQCEAFLQGQLTCDMRSLTEVPVLAAHCNPKGRIISLFWVHRYQEGVLLHLPEEMIDLATTHLDKYRLFFKTTLEIIPTPADAPNRCQLSRLDNIQQGIPSVYCATSEVFLPHRINLPDFGGVSFQKGCYTGQEIIARMEHRGQIKHHLYRALLSTPQSPGDKLPNGGIIVDACESDGQILALVTLNDDVAQSQPQQQDLIDLRETTE